MSLENAIKRVSNELKLLGEYGSFEDDVWTIIEAARRYVNPNIEAGVKAYIDKWDELSPYANTRKCFEAGLAAALTPGDTDEPL